MDVGTARTGTGGLFTAEQIRVAEAPLLAALPADTLMRRAAYGLTVAIAAELRARRGAVRGARVTALVGGGNNGGDALWAAAGLRERGVAVTAVLLDPPHTHATGLAALRAAGGAVVAAPADPAAARAATTAADLVIDGIVGLGGRGPLRGPAAELVAATTAPIVAVDLPSGVDPDTGATAGPAVRAAATVTFGGAKSVHVLAADRCGTVTVVDIGLTLPAPHARVLTDAEVGARWPVPGSGDDKYTQGVVGIVAGSTGYPGAAILSVGGAVAATSGLVRFAGAEHAAVVRAWPETIVAPSVAATDRVQAWAIGPGAGTGPATARTLARLAATELPLLIDADAITVAARHPDLLAGRTAPTLVTPHGREYARLAGRPVGADRIEAARELAARLGVTVLLKGRATIVAGPGGDTVVNDAGSSWAATAGSGDVLTGVTGALLAAGLDPIEAGACGARVHGLAAMIAATAESGRSARPAVGAPIHAGQIAACLPEAIRRVRRAAAAGHGGTMTRRE